MWTRFYDMHSGGGAKEKWGIIYIEAPEQEAKVVFYNRFGHNPDRVTCTCCGNDYSISEYSSLEEAQISERDILTLTLTIPQDKIKPEERLGEVPEQGYIWKD